MEYIAPNLLITLFSLYCLHYFLSLIQKNMQIFKSEYTASLTIANTPTDVIS